MTDFAALLAALGNRNVAFIVIGGAAAIAHGSARLTQDLDIVYDRSRDNLDRLVAALAGLNPYLRGAPPGLPFSWSRETIERGLNFTLATSLGDIGPAGRDSRRRRLPRAAAGRNRARVIPNPLPLPQPGTVDPRQARRRPPERPRSLGRTRRYRGRDRLKRFPPNRTTTS